MISVCIPVFNRDISDLVTRLAREIKTVPFETELLVIDDASTNPSAVQSNARIVEGCNGRYLRLEQNAGRTKIRRILAENASHPWLILLDNDVIPVHDNFLGEYHRHLKPDTVLCGGPVYRNELPLPEFRLHWKYGREREHVNTHSAFFSCNFCIPRAWMLKVPDFPLPCPYGHEDTLLLLWLEQNGLKVISLDNPVYHDQLKKIDRFLDHQKQALHNLLFISQQPEWRDKIYNYSPLLRTFRTCKKWGIAPILKKAFPFIEKKASNDFVSGDPSLRWLDIYKLSYFCTIAGKSVQERNN